MCYIFKIKHLDKKNKIQWETAPKLNILYRRKRNETKHFDGYRRGVKNTGRVESYCPNDLTIREKKQTEQSEHKLTRAYKEIKGNLKPGDKYKKYGQVRIDRIQGSNSVS